MSLMTTKHVQGATKRHKGYCSAHNPFPTEQGQNSYNKKTETGSNAHDKELDDMASLLSSATDLL